MKRLILLSFVWLYLYGFAAAQERTPFKILVEAKIGTGIGPQHSFYDPPGETFINRDLIGSIQGGVFITKSTIGGIGFRFDRIQKNSYFDSTNELRNIHRLNARGIMIFLQQNFRLYKRSSVNKKLGGFLRGSVSSLNFGDEKIFHNNGNSIPVESFPGFTPGESKQQFACSAALGLTYNLNEKTALLCQGTVEKSIDDFIGILSHSTANIRRQLIPYYFMQIGVRRTIYF